MLPKRSGWSTVILSWAVMAAVPATLPLVLAEDAPAAPAASAPAATLAATPAADATATPTDAASEESVKLADDFMHYVLVNNAELAKANGQKLLDANMDPQNFLQAFEKASNGREPRTVIERAIRRDELKEVATKLLTKLDDGYRASARNRERIRAEVIRLGAGYRGYQTGKDRLTAAGQYGVPVMLEVLQDEKLKALHPLILKVMQEIGRPVLPALLAQLDMSEQGDKTALVRVVGGIGYPQALPTLAKILGDGKSSDELKNAAKDAIDTITHGRGVGAMTASDLYLQAAESYFHKKPSFQAMNPDEPVNPIWVYKKELNNVEGVLVPTAIWNDVMAQRSAETSLTLQNNNAGAISLWIAAGLKREIEMPAGGKDPLHDDTKLAASFIGQAAGPLYLNPVLTMGLEDRDSALILKALAALENTAGIETLVPYKGVAAATAADAIQPGAAPAPIVRTLAFPDRAVRFKAAEILAKANPAEKYPGYYRVVPVLAEAITQTGSPNVLLIDGDQNNRNRVQEMLRSSATGYTVYSGATLAAALEGARKAAAFDLIIINSGPDTGKIREIGRTDYRLANVPVLVTTAANMTAGLRVNLQGMAGFAPLATDVADETAVTAAAKDARGSQGTPIDQTTATAYATGAIGLLKTLAVDHASIYRVDDALPALTDALKDKRPEIAGGAAGVLGQLYSVDAERALAAAALSAEITDNNVRAALFNGLAESAKKNRNAMDSAAIDKLIKVVANEQDQAVRNAAATALGALNIPSNQAGTLILQQISK